MTPGALLNLYDCIQSVWSASAWNWIYFFFLPEKDVQIGLDAFLESLVFRNLRFSSKKTLKIQFHWVSSALSRIRKHQRRENHNIEASPLWSHSHKQISEWSLGKIVHLDMIHYPNLPLVFFKKWAIPGFFYVYFRLLKQTIQFLQ